jgi:putative component of membrane protein insertase Oxa1/YidC/SpoIIIJ protein YidD
VIRNRINKVILILIISAFSIAAQEDWQKWEGKEISYEFPAISKRDYCIDNSSVGITLLSLVGNAYYFLISDLDGDNCPFTPSCSRFFIDAVKETNILSGTVMFADRFTRDMNPIKGIDHYLLHRSGKYFDPPSNYTLSLQKIKL